MNSLIDRLIRIKDGLTDRASRDAINDACAVLSKVRGLESSIRQIIAANADFREGMGPDWEGDLLQDAIDDAAKALEGSLVPAGHVEIITNGTRRIIPEDEPVFLLRGRDPFAAAAVENWASEAERGGVRPAVVEIARAHSDKMRQWPTKQLPGSTKLAEEG